MALFAGTLTALMLFLMNPQSGTGICWSLAVAAGAAFGVRELRIAEPFLDLRVLRRQRADAGHVRPPAARLGAAYAFFYGYTQWIEESRG